MKKIYCFIFVCSFLKLVSQNTDSQFACGIIIGSIPATSSVSCDGSISFTLTGFTCPPYTYTVSPGGSFTNLCPGTYTITILDQGGPGCCGIVSGTVVVQGGGVGITEITYNPKIKVFPNPALNTLHISIEQNHLKNSEIEITNTLGQTVLKSPYRNEIDVSQFLKGYYILKVIRSNKQQYSSKFIKE